MIRINLTITIFLLAFCSTGQGRNDIRNYIPTENLDSKKDANKRANRTKKRRYDVIYRSNVRNILYGNPCAVEATQRMGFEYLVESRRISGSKTQKGKFLNNLWVKSKLVVFRTPFWKAILNGKFKKCRSKSGDIVG